MSAPSGSGSGVPLQALITGAAILITAMATLLAFVQAQRANRAQARASHQAVDAAAYERAKNLYEGVIEAITEERSMLRAEVTALRDEVRTLRRSNEQLSEEIGELHAAKRDLSAQVAKLRQAVARMGGKEQ